MAHESPSIRALKAGKEATVETSCDKARSLCGLAKRTLDRLKELVLKENAFSVEHAYSLIRTQRTIINAIMTLADAMEKSSEDSDTVNKIKELFEDKTEE
jgi:vacuolar-type H+-ATPase catalytic subunit A/Vma1